MPAEMSDTFLVYTIRATFQRCMRESIQNQGAPAVNPRQRIATRGLLPLGHYFLAALAAFALAGKFQLVAV